MKMKRFTICLILFGLILGIASFANADRASAVAVIDKAIRDGVITHVSYADYYVNGIAWMYLNAQQKQNFALACAMHYEDNGGGALRSNIYHSHTGKKVAKYGAFGAKIY